MPKKKDEKHGSKVQDSIPVPLPGDDKKGPISTCITDEKGLSYYNIRIIKPGRHKFHLEFKGDDKFKPVKSSEIIITVTPDVSTKKAITNYNKVLRSSITSSNNVSQIKEHLEWSKTMYELCSGKLQKIALREFEKTSKISNKRIDELRTIKREWGIDAQIGIERLGFKVKKKTEMK